MGKVFHFPIFPVEPLMPSATNNSKEISFKINPSVSKPEVKKFLESVYGLEVEKVRTLNMQGKRKMIGGRLVAKPNYKKVYVSLKKPLSINHDLNFTKFSEEEMRNKQSRSVNRKDAEVNAVA